MRYKVANFFIKKKKQALQVNNSIILMIKNAKFSGITFYEQECIKRYITYRSV